MKGTGEMQPMLNSSSLIISRSRVMRSDLLVVRRCSEESKLIILLKEGEIGYSHLAARSMEIVARCTRLGALAPRAASDLRKRSAMLTARCMVSTLYSFRRFSSWMRQTICSRWCAVIRREVV